MKKFLILVSIVLAAATTGMFAQVATEPVAPDSAPAQTSPAKGGKHKHRKHKKHRKQAKRAHRKHHGKRAAQT